MSKIKIKAEIRSVKKDLEYYMKEYELNQKEAYEVLYERYYIKMNLCKPYVEQKRIDQLKKEYEVEDHEGEKEE